MNVIAHPDPTAVAEAAANLVAADIDAGIGNVGLAGGTTPRATYERLAELAVDWSDTTLWLGDERWVPEGHPDSNAGMARDAFVDSVGASLLPLEYEIGEPVLAARAYDRTLHRVFGDQGPGLVLLGLGDDGHTASLFPRSAALRTRRAGYVATWVDAKGVWRLTATLPLLWQAHHVMFLVTGEAKATVLAEIEAGHPYPSQQVAAGARRVTWLVDEAAASQLTNR